MILLLSTWTKGYVFEPVDWAVVSLNLETIDKYLARIAQAKRIHCRDMALNNIRYWDCVPTWCGYSAIWEELYTDSVQIVNCLQRDTAQPPPFSTSCTVLVVTPEGVAWETTLKSSPGAVGTSVATLEVLLELKARLLEERRTGQPIMAED